MGYMTVIDIFCIHLYHITHLLSVTNEMRKIWKPILYAGIGGAGVAAALTAYLTKKYPVHETSSANLPTSIKRALPKDTNPYWRYCEITIPANTTVQRTKPMESFIRQFYDIWALKLEEAFAKSIGYQEKFFPAPYTKEYIRKAHCGGLFPELSRDDNTCMIFFGPGGAIPAMADLQAFEAVPDDRGNLRLRYYTGNVDVPGAQTDEGVMGWFHMMYVRFLLDSAQRKMRHEKEGELPKER